MFYIGRVKIEGKIICAPMAGVTNQAFRKLVKNQGAALVYTEMTSTLGLKNQIKKALEHTQIDAIEYPLAIQIFGGDTEDYVEAATYFDKYSTAAIIDINMGCPVPKVAIKSGAGSSLLKTPDKIANIITAIKAQITKPLTIKLRLGWDLESKMHVKIAKLAEAAGVDAIAIHGRTRSEFFSGKADWNAIKEVKDAVRIPVIGNGDVWTPEDAKAMLDQTGVDAVMVGRAAQECPWIIKQMHDYVTHGHYEPLPNLNETVLAIKTFYENLKDLKGEKIALAQIRTPILNWLKRFKDTKQARQAIVMMKTWTEIATSLEQLVINKK